MDAKTELNLVQQIAVRAAIFYAQHSQTRDVLQIAAEIMIVHRHVVPLRLAAMLDGRDLDFIHDIAGINRHLEIGPPARLGGCFLPRFAEV